MPSRLPPLRYDDLGPQGRRVWDEIVASRGDGVVGADGALAGPFNAFVHAPGVGGWLSGLGAELRFGTAIDPRLRELAILTVSAAWKAEFEWFAHAGLTRAHGVGEAVIEAIARGEDPAFESPGERTVYRLARELTRGARLDEETFEAGRRLLGDAGMVEMITLCGYYTLVSYLLNALEVEPPDGSAPRWG